MLRPLAIGCAFTLAACSPAAPRPSSIGSPDASSDDVFVPTDDLPAADRPSVVPDVPVVTDVPARDVAPFDATVRPYPFGPYGVGVGDNFEPFELTDCANRPYVFSGPEFVSSRATVVILNAAYSAAGRALTQAVQSMVELPYRSHALRTVEVLVDGESVSEPASLASCVAWVDVLHLGHRVLIDPTTMLGARVPMRQFPMVFLLDENARIVWVTYGAGASAADLRVALERLVGPP